MPARPRGSSTRAKSKPSHRPVDAAYVTWGRVRNGKPGYQYRLVSLAGDAVAEYMDMGWEPVLWEIDSDGEIQGPHVLTGRKKDRVQGAEIVARDHLLMEMDNEKYQEIVDNGAFNSGGQKLADKLEERIVDRHGFEDPMRGIHRGTAHIRADEDHGETETFVQ